MIQALLLFLLGLLVVAVAVLTGTLGKIWLALFKQELNLPFGKKKDTTPPLG
jgi:hypothetical protein